MRRWIDGNQYAHNMEHEAVGDDNKHFGAVCLKTLVHQLLNIILVFCKVEPIVIILIIVRYRTFSLSKLTKPL